MLAMILGIGTDLVEVARVASMMERHGGRALDRIFTPAEAAHCRAAGRPAESFAARFAAKEAFFKALGTGWSEGMGWTDVEVVSLESGAPTLRLHGAARERAEAMGATRAHVSLTHTAEVAGAFVVLETGAGR